MTIKSVQKLINIGSNSQGVTLPARDLAALGAKPGDEFEITAKLRKASQDPNDEILDHARQLINDYRQDFENLANR